MLSLLLAALLTQGGLPPWPEALPRADPRMILDDTGAKQPQTESERRAHRLRQRLFAVLYAGSLTRQERRLIFDVINEAKPEAFEGNAEGRKKLRTAVQELRGGVRKQVLEAIGEIDLPEPSRKPPFIAKRST